MKKFFTLLTAVVLAVGSISAQTVLYENNFDDGNKEGMAFYDQDKLQPSSFMASVGFAIDNPWVLVKDSNTSPNMFIASTSQYTPAGQADDWMVLPAIEVTNENYILEWESQAYKFDKPDGLAVYVSTTGNTPADFPAEPVWEVEAEEVGATEDFEGEFIHHSISLAAYEGQTVYIAFVNQSYDKALIAVDNIKVYREDNFNVTLDFGKHVYQQDELNVSGVITNNKYDLIDEINVSLTYGGTTVEETISGLNIAKGESGAFAMQHAMPLTFNQEIEYTLVVSANDYDFAINSSVTNTFHQYVVIEDHTGLWCVNCPAGYWAIDSLKHVAPDNIAAISVQNSQGVYNPRLVNDTYDMGLSGAGLTSYPSGWINRTHIALPWGNGEYGFEDPNSWISLFDKEMEQLPEAGVEAVAYFSADGKWAQATAKVRTADNKENIDWRIVFVVTEDSVTGFYQNNGLSGKNMWLGGWESKPRNVSVVLDDLARGIYPSFYGEKGSMPASIAVGEEATYSLGIELPLTTIDKSGETVEIIQNVENLNLIAMLVDGKTDRVINADKVRITNAPESVEGIEGDKLSVSVFTENGDVKVVAYENTPLTATLYAIDGRVIASATGYNNLTIDAAGYRGVALVQVVCNGESQVTKVVLR